MPPKRRPERERLDDPEYEALAHLTIDEQLEAFLTAWEATRTAQAKKFQRRAEYYFQRVEFAGWENCYLSDRRAQRHYEHEIKMLQELRARALDVRQSAT